MGAYLREDRVIVYVRIRKTKQARARRRRGPAEFFHFTSPRRRGLDEFFYFTSQPQAWRLLVFPLRQPAAGVVHSRHGQWWQ